jgi:hypothetical protein
MFVGFGRGLTFGLSDFRRFRTFGGGRRLGKFVGVFLKREGGRFEGERVRGEGGRKSQNFPRGGGLRVD